MKRSIIFQSSGESYIEKIVLEDQEKICLCYKRRDCHSQPYFNGQDIITFLKPGQDIVFYWWKKNYLNNVSVNGLTIFEVDAYYREDDIFKEILMEGEPYNA